MKTFLDNLAVIILVLACVGIVSLLGYAIYDTAGEIALPMLTMAAVCAPIVWAIRRLEKV